MADRPDRDVNILDKWAERVYAETDFGRSVATSTSGIVGLIVYLVYSDWVITLLSLIISFPLFRLVAADLHGRAIRNRKSRTEKEEAERLYGRLSNEEKEVVQAFVKAGGSVMTWRHFNRQPLSGPAVESLIQRGVLWSSVTADGMTETFALDSALFDVGQDRLKADRTLEES